MEITDMIEIHPALAEVLPELVAKISAELTAIEIHEPSRADIQRRINALNGPDRVGAMLDVASLFAALYAVFTTMERRESRH